MGAGSGERGSADDGLLWATRRGVSLEGWEQGFKRSRAPAGVLGGHGGVTATQSRSRRGGVDAGHGDLEVRAGKVGGRGSLGGSGRVSEGELGRRQSRLPGPPTSSRRAPRPTLTSSGFFRMAAVAAQSRFSNPAGTRPVGKFVSSSTKGMAGGKRVSGHGRVNAKCHGRCPKVRNGEQGWGDTNQASHWLGRHAAPSAIGWLGCTPGRQLACARALVSGSPKARPAPYNPTHNETLAEPWPRPSSSHTFSYGLIGLPWSPQLIFIYMEV